MTEQSTAMVPVPQALEDYAMGPESLVKQVSLIQSVMSRVMKKGEHFGTIPGCGPKPVLLKAGAEKLALTFRLAPRFSVIMREMKDDHREYEVLTELVSIVTGDFCGQGIGSCSTKEKRFHKTSPADVYNSVLKMAKKRSLVDAILTATAASDIFTQDLEDLPSEAVHRPPQTTQRPQGDQGQAQGVMSEPQRRKLWAMCMQAGLDRDQAKAFVDSLAIQTVRDASQAIEHFQERLDAWREPAPVEGELVPPDDCPF
jgi:hypothetical protein